MGYQYLHKRYGPYLVTLHFSPATCVATVARPIPSNLTPSDGATRRGTPRGRARHWLDVGRTEVHSPAESMLRAEGSEMQNAKCGWLIIAGNQLAGTGANDACTLQC